MKQKLHWPFENTLKKYFTTRIPNTKFHMAINGEDWQKNISGSKISRSVIGWLNFKKISMFENR